MPEFGTRPPEKRERTELTAATEHVKGIDLVNEVGFPTVRVECLAAVGGRRYYRVSTERKGQSFDFYTTRKGLLRHAE